MPFKTKKRKKAGRFRGRNSHGHGSRKKWRSSGEQGGFGMAGTGKRADHKKSLVIKLYGNNYFGKQGITSRGTAKDKSKFMNLRDIEKKYEKGEVNLKEYKILGDGEITKALTIKARGFTKSAKEKIEKAGGKTILTKTYEDRKTEKIKDAKDNKKSE
ncbi:MAG: uL15 family ribosomal protein [Candidatus Nanoarchaeia archaeon]|nr:uL15 family ribosomal protein [Candidatus Nanoarchaeia archaeon]MDD5741736.1 uL15 family ribosomal protein [Candidatus Nanoarchaeia archaeon]